MRLTNDEEGHDGCDYVEVLPEQQHQTKRSHDGQTWRYNAQKSQVRLTTHPV